MNSFSRSRNLLRRLSPVLLAGVSFAQGNTGSIRGTILDPTGASLPGVTIEITSEATGVTKTLTTSSAGFCAEDALTPAVTG